MGLDSKSKIIICVTGLISIGGWVVVNMVIGWGGGAEIFFMGIFTGMFVTGIIYEVT